MMKEIFDDCGFFGGCLFLLIAVGIIAGLFILLGWIFSLLWNFAMPQICSNAPNINLWTGTAVVIIFKILFGGLIKYNKK